MVGTIFTASILLNGCISPPEATSERVSIREFTLLTEDNVTISVSHFSYGQPNVCLLAHGFMGNKHRPYIEKLSKRLSKCWDIITFDFRGHGDSQDVCNGLKEFYDTVENRLEAEF